MVQAIAKIYAVEEYLRLEEVAESRSEYHNGEIVTMAGESPEHNEICINLILALKPQLRDGFKLYASDIKLWIPQYNRYVYPDLIIAESPNWFAWERGGKALTNASLIIEVLSESTRNYDQGDKFRFYRSISELEEYLMIDQYRINVLHYRKSEGGWFFQEYQDKDTSIHLSTIGINLPMMEVYRGVEVDE